MRRWLKGTAAAGLIAAVLAAGPAAGGDPFSLSGLLSDEAAMPAPLAWAFPGFRVGIRSQYGQLMRVRAHMENGEPAEAYRLAAATVLASLEAKEQVLAALVLAILGNVRDGGVLASAAVEFLHAKACSDRLASPTALDFTVRGAKFAVSPDSIIARVLHYGFDRDLPACGADYAGDGARVLSYRVDGR